MDHGDGVWNMEFRTRTPTGVERVKLFLSLGLLALSSKANTGVHGWKSVSRSRKMCCIYTVVGQSKWQLLRFIYTCY